MRWHAAAPPEGGSQHRRAISATLHPLILDLGCCGVSAQQIGAPGFDLPGSEGSNYDLDPWEANALIVAGRVSPALVPLVRSLHERMTGPQWVIAYGVCATSGVVFGTVPLSDVLSVDVWVPGCPPHTAALRRALACLPRRRRQ